MQPNPGTAIQDDYDTTLIPDIVLGENQTETTADVKTRRNTRTKLGINISQQKLQMLVKERSLGFNKKS